MSKFNPWSSHSEFLEVASQLEMSRILLSVSKMSRDSPGSLSSEALQARDSAAKCLACGVQTVAIWRKRAQTRLPHAVDTTAKLSEAILCDVTRSLSNDALRSIYSLAIMRGVNGLTDSANQRSGHATSVSSLASGIDLPSWLVDLRRDISHNDLPDLPCLRLGATHLLSYLYEKYWEVKREGVLMKLEEAHSLLMKYKSSSKADSKSAQQAALNCCKLYTSTTPSTLIEPCAIHFLVNDARSSSAAKWGGPSANEGGEDGSKAPPPPSNPKGALIPSSPDIITEDDAGFELCVKRYRPLLVATQNSSSTFAANLLVALVNFVVKLEKEGERGECDAGGVQAAVGRARKLFFAMKWIEFLVSRDFVSLFHQPFASFKKGANLREKAQLKWSDDEKLFMKGRVYCREMLYPLNSLCDDLEAQVLTASCSFAILKVFEGILSDRRARVIKRSLHPPTQANNDDGSNPRKKYATAPSSATSTGEKMTLEEMESLCFGENDGAHDNGTIDDGAAKASPPRAPWEPVLWEEIVDFEPVDVHLDAGDL